MEPSIHDLAYQGKIDEVKEKVKQNPNLAKSLDSVSLYLKVLVFFITSKLTFLKGNSHDRKHTYFYIFQSKRNLIHWAALGGHVDLVDFLLDREIPSDVVDDVKLFSLLKFFTKKLNFILYKKKLMKNSSFSEQHDSLDFGIVSRTNICGRTSFTTWSECK